MEDFSNSKGIGLLSSSANLQLGSSRSKKYPNFSQWNILKENVILPAACLNQEKLQNNLRWMQTFVSHYPSTYLAPHGKTTMAPQLFAKQLEAGAWGITLATVQQVQVAINFGVKNILLANQLAGQSNMKLTSEALKANKEIQFICIVDSVENIRQLGAHFQKSGLKLKVLIEIGVNYELGGRTGIRSTSELALLLQELSSWKNTLELVGIEFFEGVRTTADAVREFIQSDVALVLNKLLAQTPTPFSGEEIILSGAGSAYFDIVAEELSKLSASITSSYGFKIILRAGCYLTQDSGAYQAAFDRMRQNDSIISKMESTLLPALQIWSYVQSKPEPGLVILGMGRRDVSFDAGMPKPALHFSTGSVINKAPVDISNNKGWTITKLMDQHAFMKVDCQSDFERIEIGDMIAVNICHPCTTFDKWRNVLLIDNEYNVTEIIQTYF